jgi:hypothetical protein
MRQIRKLLKYCLFLFLLIFKAIAEDVFCGPLTIYKQQWLARHASTISSQTTQDLKECLDICCSIPNCNAVTFMGFISNSSQEAATTNCMMFSCNEKCVVVDRPTAAEGVISVIINKTTTVVSSLPLSQGITSTTLASILLPNIEETETQLPPIIPSTFPRPPEGFSSGRNSTAINDGSSLPSTSSTKNSTMPSSTRSALSGIFPIWVVGLAIVIAVCCIGVNVVLLSAFCCYKRHKHRMRSENFTIKPATLHAFNPTT